MVEVVETQHGGMVNKFLGDGFMAIFGAGSVNPRHADDALAAARTMQRQLDALNVQLAQRGEAPIELGIGINTGAAIVGSIGSPERLEFTVIGSAVNLASRIQALTKTIGKPLLVTETTAESLVVRDGLHDCGPQEVRGVDQPVRVFAG